MGVLLILSGMDICYLLPVLSCGILLFACQYGNGFWSETIFRQNLLVIQALLQ